MSDQRPNPFRGDYVQDERRVGEQATRGAVWSIVSYLEWPANVAASIRQIEIGPFPIRYSVQGVNESYKEAQLPKRLRQPLDRSAEEEVLRAADLAATAMRHGHAYFDAVANAPNTVRPTLLYYGCLSLAKAISAATLTWEGGPTGHGLEMAKDDLAAVKIQNHGEFITLHDAVATNVKFLISGRAYQLDWLLCGIPGVREAAQRVGGRWDEALRGTDVNQEGIWASMNDTGKEEERVWTHTLALELVASFILSNWSRYSPVEWERTLRGEGEGGKRSGDAYVYLAAMDYIALDFPLKIANMITGRRHWFGAKFVTGDEIIDQLRNNTRLLF